MCRRILVAVALATLVLAPLQAAKLDELARPKDYSRDHQVPAPAAPEAILYQVDFNAGLPGDWTVVDNESGGPVWSNLAGCGEAANYTGSTGDVACVSSDVFGLAEFDTELLTPTFNFCGASAPLALGAVINYQNFANLDFLEIDVSTDGVSWTNLLSWNEDHGAFRATPGEEISLDVSAYAGLPSVQFRFHYFDPNSNDYDWYAQVDDVTIDGTGAVTTPGVPTCAIAPGPTALEIPTLSTLGLVAAGLALLTAAAVFLRRRRSA